MWDSFMLAIFFLQFKQNQQLDTRFLSAVVSVGFFITSVAVKSAVQFGFSHQKVGAVN